MDERIGPPVIDRPPYIPEQLILKFHPADWHRRILQPGAYVFYLCHPYTRDPAGAWQLATEVAEWMIAHNLVLFSAIMHTHHFEMEAAVKHDPEIFYRWDLQLMSLFQSTRLIVLVQQDWKHSVGCEREMAFAQKNGILCLQLEPFMDRFHMSRTEYMYKEAIDAAPDMFSMLHPPRVSGRSPT